MSNRKSVGFSLAAVATVAFLLAGASPASAGLTTGEVKCAASLGKAAAKLAKTIAKEYGKCRNGDISGKAPGTCPTAKNTAKIDKMKNKLKKAVDKSCGSVCSKSNDIPCLTSDMCPPLGTGFHEKCSGVGGLNPFDMTRLGFPGPFCEPALGHRILEKADFATCGNILTEETALQLVDVIYGALDNTSGVSSSAAKCLAGLSKATQKLAATIQKGVVKCRDGINKGKVVADPATCTRDDLKLAQKIAKMEQKLRDTATKKCIDSDIVELDLCGTVAAPTTTTEAADCLIAAAEEIADSNLPASSRSYAPRSLIEATYPPARGVCGDGAVNQLPNPFALLGEECDGADDDACPGQCLPPGDIFECTCPGPRRVRFMADGLTADLDNGWTGASHNGGVADGAAHIYELANCDCDQLAPNGTECIGTTTDAVCDRVSTYQLPSCSWDIFSGTSCDAHGTDADTKNEDQDCFICDELSANAGAWCANDSDCQSQCYDANGVATGPCTQQSDCAAGEVCRGLCDQSQTCIIMPNGAPLPISSEGTAVCVFSDFRFNVFGTQNILTGEHEEYTQLFSKVHLGNSQFTPCPVCGGVCDNNHNQPCEGRCSVTAAQKCRFDTDCPSGETCSQNSPDCPGSFCNLSLVCRGGDKDGEVCRVEAATRDFGTTSHDCTVPAGANISGDGLQINYLPSTSERVELPPVLQCTAAGFENFDCPCPQAGGVMQTKPNNCAAACDAGPSFGQGCAIGGGFSSGLFTTCEGSGNPSIDGKACDEDADCAPGTCTANPTHCEGTGDPNLELTQCTTNADCGAGTCVDACPGGHCVPLCVPTADPNDEPEEGECAGGPVKYHCSSKDFIVCGESQATASCSATCSVSGTPCDEHSDCPTGETCTGSCPKSQLCDAGNDAVMGTSDDIVGAGTCIVDSRPCFLATVAGEGGDTLNGKGGPDTPFSSAVFCIAGTGNGSIDGTAGLGGPGRLTQHGVNVTNGFTSLP